ncbi:MAG: hypothetical protein JEZ01_11915 [Labilibaculum sp.]|nr:hypothetical protein [Labilibaculum sp.]MBI9058459.1 hypothetical protein [Labilibaculum sp.]
MQKYYSEKQIYFATFLGGPIPPGILIYKNFKQIGDDKRASLALIITFIFTSILFYGLMQIPEEISDKIPNLVFSSLYTGIVYLVYHHYLADSINDLLIETENKASNWAVTGFTIFGVLINILIIISFAFSTPLFPGDKMIYGEIEHEIYFDEGTISESNLQEVGRILTDFEYFYNDMQQAVRIESTENDYTLILPIGKENWHNADLLFELDNLKQVQNNDTGELFHLQLIHWDLSGKTHKKNL